MPKIKKYIFIIGFAFLTGLTIQTKSVFALYSPRLSQQADRIREHIRDSQAQNGTESILEEIEQIKAYDKAKREAFKETGISGNVRVAQDLIFNTTFPDLIQFPYDSLFMVFNFNIYNNEFISTCLRDEIWNLEALRDVVGAEMVKAYMLRDTYHGALLMEDYKYLITYLDLLRKYGSDPDAEIHAIDPATKKPVTISSSKYFFGNDADRNYYNSVYGFISNEGGCPEGEFQNAFRAVVNSAKTLSVLASGKGVEWGSIWEMAKQNARIRAREWIRANQISLTIGGKNGGRIESLVQGGGWGKFVGNFKTQLNIVRNMVGPVTPLFELSKWIAVKTAEGTGIVDECVFYYKPDTITGGRLEQGGVFRNCDDEQKQQYLKCQEDIKAAMDEGIRCDRFKNTKESISVSDYLAKQQALKLEHDRMIGDTEDAFIYSVTMDSVAEQNIYEMDQILWDMNMNIKRGYEAVDKAAGEGIPTLFREVEKLAARQCANKNR